MAGSEEFLWAAGPCDAPPACGSWKRSIETCQGPHLLEPIPRAMEFPGEASWIPLSSAAREALGNYCAGSSWSASVEDMLGALDSLMRLETAEAASHDGASQ